MSTGTPTQTGQNNFLQLLFTTLFLQLFLIQSPRSAMAALAGASIRLEGLFVFSPPSKGRPAVAKERP